ncbi:Integral membrane pth11 protein [Rutstroemia sp. NJR-2017a WRK4]|nr:Integral membrane pth11 protein [Rutstroemia sp. NJR-2017a WRK4]
MTANLIAEIWTCWAIALAFVVLRFYTRLWTLGWKKLGLEDALMIWAWISYTVEATSSYYLSVVWRNLSNAGMTDAERASLDPDSKEWRYRVNGSITHIVQWFAYVNLMWALKGCWLAYFTRLTSLNKMKIQIRIGYFLTAFTYVGSMIVIPCKCLPFRKQWQIYPNPGDNCIPGYSSHQMKSIIPINAATDLYLLLIPVPMVFWTYRGIPIGKRISLLVLFSAGFVIIGCAILRALSIVGVSGNITSSGAWSLRESFLAILITNFPILLPLLQHWYRVYRGEAKLHSFTGTPISHGLELTPRYTISSARSRARKASVAKSVAWDSDEQIMVPKNTLQRVPSARVQSWDVADLGLDLVPTKEKSHMRTTVMGGLDQRRSRWRNLSMSREERRGSVLPQVVVEEGRIMVVEEFTYSAAGRTSRDQVVVGL